MKKLILGVLVTFGVSSCVESNPIPTSSSIPETQMRQVDKLDDGYGVIRVYTYGQDTIYTIEGRSSSYPVGLYVK